MEITKTDKIGNKEYPEEIYVIKDKIRPKRKKRVKEQVMQPTMAPPLKLDPALFQPQEQQLSSEQATALIMQFMGDIQKINMHSELTDDRIVNLMAIQSIGKAYDIELLQFDIPNTLLPLLVSKDREGRKEIIQLIKAWSSGKGEQGLMNKLRGLY